LGCAVTEDINHPENFLPSHFPERYAGRMNTILKSSLIMLSLSTFALAQSAPTKTAASPASSSASNAGQHDAAANKSQSSGSHAGNMVGNHKDVMETVDKNTGSHTSNMSGNHKDVMGAAASPSAGKSTKSNPNSPQ
jgi:hypothetical protein